MTVVCCDRKPDGRRRPARPFSGFYCLRRNTVRRARRGEITFNEWPQRAKPQQNFGQPAAAANLYHRSPVGSKAEQRKKIRMEDKLSPGTSRRQTRRIAYQANQMESEGNVGYV
nr:uncharacterized protein LOC109397515 [Aedes albopictus]XP_029715080.1 uncharacterized protein LOC115258799 [Aedes albopictus]XP_029727122.1 uncharacterized protein LOC115265586 [Aedes albopictus]